MVGDNNSCLASHGHTAPLSWEGTEGCPAWDPNVPHNPQSSDAESSSKGHGGVGRGEGEGGRGTLPVFVWITKKKSS